MIKSRSRLPRSVLLLIMAGCVLAGFAGLWWFTTKAASNPAADLNHDGQVNVFDLSMLLSHWGNTGTGAIGDVNADNSVNIFDLSIMLAAWGAVTTPTPTVAPTPTPTPTPTPSPVGACTLKPGPTTVGSSGTLTNRPAGDVTLTSGQTLQDTRVTGHITINGTNVTVRNVFVTEGLLVQSSNTVMIDRVTMTDGMAISSSQNVTMQYTNIGHTDEDGTHVTSDSGSMNQNIVFSHNYIHTPEVDPDSHYDGTQIRGVQTMTIHCSTYDLGPWQFPWNAVIYSEHPANGGNTNVTVSNNWLYGGAFTFMGSGPNIKLLGNRIGGDIHWGLCSPGDLSTMTSTGNVMDATNQPVALCK